jgi:hypothetical protein
LPRTIGGERDLDPFGGFGGRSGAGGAPFLGFSFLFKKNNNNFL